MVTLSKICAYRRNKNIRKRLNNYPCDAYLHIALDFISVGKGDAAYEAICNAITKSGGKLARYESDALDAIRYNRSITKACRFEDVNCESLDLSETHVSDVIKTDLRPEERERIFPDPSWARDD